MILLYYTMHLHGENWPDFRGTNGDGYSDAHGLPTEWSETKNVRWKTPLPNTGWSSPVVWDNQIWLTCATDDGREQFALCLDRSTGKLLQKLLMFRNPIPQDFPRGNNTYASPSPVIEKGRVYVHFGTFGTACIDTQRFTILWTRRDLNCQHAQGPGSSPFLLENKLILTYDGMDVQFLVALETKTGKTLWKTDRNTPFGEIDGDLKKAFTTPYLLRRGNQSELVSIGARAFCGYAPQTGRELWRIPHPGFSNAARPVAGNGMLFLITGFNRPELWGIRLPSAAGPSESDVLWRYTKGVPNLSSPLLVDDLLYFVADSEVITCLEATTGREVFKERIGGKFYASPLWAQGKIYLFSAEGKARVIQPGRRLTSLAENELESGPHASPAACGKALYVRTSEHLYCLEQG
jgi:outer membrane protein assembly factor BamB